MTTNCSIRHKKSTMEAFSTSPQTIKQGSEIGYTTFDSTGCSIVANGSTGVQIEKSGLYLISFNCSATGESVGDISIQLERDGIVVPRGQATESVGATTDITNLEFSTIVEVLGSCNCVNNKPIINVVNTGVSATFNNVDLLIIKIA